MLYTDCIEQGLTSPPTQLAGKKQRKFPSPQYSNTMGD